MESPMATNLMFCTDKELSPIKRTRLNSSFFIKRLILNRKQIYTILESVFGFYKNVFETKSGQKKLFLLTKMFSKQRCYT